MMINLILVRSFLAEKLLYLDPGSGSLLVQMVIAAIIGLGVLIRLQWSRIKKWFGKGKEIVNEEDSEDE
jgi:hypothetical protein